jgi:hypothetical protein
MRRNDKTVFLAILKLQPVEQFFESLYNRDGPKPLARFSVVPKEKRFRIAG